MAGGEGGGKSCINHWAQGPTINATPMPAVPLVDARLVRASGWSVRTGTVGFRVPEVGRIAGSAFPLRSAAIPCASEYRAQLAAAPLTTGERTVAAAAAAAESRRAAVVLLHAPAAAAEVPTTLAAVVLLHAPAAAAETTTAAAALLHAPDVAGETTTAAAAALATQAGTGAVVEAGVACWHFLGAGWPPRECGVGAFCGACRRSVHLRQPQSA